MLDKAWPNENVAADVVTVRLALNENVADGVPDVSCVPNIDADGADVVVNFFEVAIAPGNVSVAEADIVALKLKPPVIERVVTEADVVGTFCPNVKVGAEDLAGTGTGEVVVCPNILSVATTGLASVGVGCGVLVVAVKLTWGKEVCCWSGDG